MGRKVENAIARIVTTTGKISGSHKALKVTFKNEVEVAFPFGHDFWKFKFSKEPLRDKRRQRKILEKLKVNCSDKLNKLVQTKRNKRIVEA